MAHRAAVCKLSGPRPRVIIPLLVQVQLCCDSSKETTCYCLCSRTNDPVSVALWASRAVSVLVSKLEPVARSRLSVSRLSLLDANAPLRPQEMWGEN